MRILATAARGLKNMWAQGDDEDYIDEEEGFDTDETEADAPYHYSSERDSAGYGGSSARAQMMRSSAPTSLRTKEKNIYTSRPKNQDDAAVAADYLKGGSAVIVNLENVDFASAVRIIDFMSGVCYGLEGQGHAMKLGDAIFLFTPTEFEISSDDVGYGKNHDFYFKSIGKTNDKTQAAAPAPQPQSTFATSSPATATTGTAAAPTASASATSGPGRQQTPSSYTTPSGYVTADYAAPSTAASPRAQVSPAARISSGANFSSSGKAHVLVGGKPVDTNTNTNKSPSASSGANPASSSASSTSSPGTYQSNERRSWER